MISRNAPFIASTSISSSLYVPTRIRSRKTPASASQLPMWERRSLADHPSG